MASKTPKRRDDKKRSPAQKSTSPAQRKKGLTGEELDQQSSENLPEREEMALINANLAIPINAAVAANVLSDDAIAYADADQDAWMDQSS